MAQAARVLDEARLQAAPRFGEAVTAQMARLEMGGAQLVCAVEPLERAAWTLSLIHISPSVRERYERQAEANPAQAARMAQLIDNFDEAVNHPDENDLARLRAAVEALP